MLTTIITVTGKVSEIGEAYEINPSRLCQRIVIEVINTDPRVKTDYFAVFAYGADIAKLWEGYKNDFKPITATITAKLNGRMLKGRNTLTLSFKSVRWNYY